jgi:hypothetical protein
MIVDAQPSQLFCAVRPPMDNVTLIRTFVEQMIGKQSAFLYNSELRIEPVGDALQLVAASGGIIAVSHLSDTVSQVAVRHQSSHWNTVHTVMAEAGFLPTGKSRMAGFYEYQRIVVPSGYQVRFTDALDILQTWWSYKNPEKMMPIMAMLILHRGHWYAIQDLICHQGTLLIHTLKDTLKLYPLDRILWLQKGAAQTSPAAEPETVPVADRHCPTQTPDASLEPPAALEPVPLSRSKKIGAYLVDAALLTTAQTEVALCDQQATGMRFGEILVKRGWLKEETIEFLMKNVILPQRAAARRKAGLVAQRTQRRIAHKLSAPLLPKSLQANTHTRSTLVDTVTAEPLPSSSRLPSPVPSPVTTLHSRETLATHHIPDCIDLPPQAVSTLHSRETLITHDLELEDPNFCNVSD